ncbi:MAG: SAM-dependent methyltransferase [Candidatus Omnitrophota bacterium]
MAFELTEIVPWGRSFDEYVAMFGLTQDDLGKKILCSADGPASFNAGMKKQGLRAISCDPIYQFSAAEIKVRIDACFPDVIKHALSNKDSYVWKNIASIDDLGRIRMQSMNEFLADFEEGKREGRYIPYSLPALSFKDGSFDIALCSHFLFLYSAHLTFEFHLESVIEMCRVAGETRIFPLLNLDGKVSPYLEPLVAELNKKGYETEIRKVGYEFQRGGDEMLRIKAKVDQREVYQK